MEGSTHKTLCLANYLLNGGRGGLAPPPHPRLINNWPSMFCAGHKSRGYFYLQCRDENSSRPSAKIRSNTFSGRPVSSSDGHLADQQYSQIGVV